VSDSRPWAGDMASRDGAGDMASRDGAASAEGSRRCSISLARHRSARYVRSKSVSVYENCVVQIAEVVLLPLKTPVNGPRLPVGSLGRE
jgi:hypothetical protein